MVYISVSLICCRLISLGIEFCGKGSDSLQESIRLQSLKYFKTYHRLILRNINVYMYQQTICRNLLDDLRAFLENEAWEICPVCSSFTIHSLRVSSTHVQSLSYNIRITRVSTRVIMEVKFYTPKLLAGKLLKLEYVMLVINDRSWWVYTHMVSHFVAAIVQALVQLLRLHVHDFSNNICIFFQVAHVFLTDYT